MAISRVRVFLTTDGKWAVQSDGQDSAPFTYLSQGEAIAAGVPMAMEHDAVLTIHGLNVPDFRDCDARMAA
ncbi:DUF2188 domain-containing protein [Cupriavidus necator]|uniref:DUF2188 domain-containing protein n=1 Tax=Cupriavidus necator TaxID=106590 RepID=UPI0005A122DB|nr:DUF2188 domain-containing protein [Cupriavidus necator]